MYRLGVLQLQYMTYFVGEHFLQPIPIRRASRRPGINELTNDLSAEIRDFAFTGRALRWDRVPLGFPVFAGLTRGRDTQVEHCSVGCSCFHLGGGDGWAEFD